MICMALTGNSSANVGGRDNWLLTELINPISGRRKIGGSSKAYDTDC